MFLIDPRKSDVHHWSLNVSCLSLIPESLLFVTDLSCFSFVVDPWKLVVRYWSLKFVVRYWTLKFYRSTLNPKSLLFFIDPWKFPVCSAVTWAKAPKKTLGDKHSSTLLKITLKITVNNHWNVKIILKYSTIQPN